jgi:hypothetical protein
MCICCLANTSRQLCFSIGYQFSHYTSVSLSLWCSCVTTVSRCFYHRLVNWYGCYLSSIGYCRYNSVVLSYIGCQIADQSEVHTQSKGSCYRLIQADSSCLPYQSNMVDQSLVFLSLSTHFYQPIYRQRNRLYIYRSHTLNHTPIGCTSLNCCADIIEPMQPHLVT